jgi:hypothetical protein
MTNILDSLSVIDVRLTSCSCVAIDVADGSEPGADEDVFIFTPSMLLYNTIKKGSS